MKFRYIKKENYKWWNPLSWGKKIEFTLEQSDLLICKDSLNFGNIEITFNFEGTLCFPKNRQKETMKIVKEFLYKKVKQGK